MSDIVQFGLAEKTIAGYFTVQFTSYQLREVLAALGFSNTSQKEAEAIAEGDLAGDRLLLGVGHSQWLYVFSLPRHLHESDAARPARIPILDDRDRPAPEAASALADNCRSGKSCISV